MLNAARQQHGQEEADLAQRISKVETTIAGVLETAGVSAPSNCRRRFNPSCADSLTDLLPARTRLREIRLVMREQAESLGVA
jgi:hypothetical protein